MEIHFAPMQGYADEEYRRLHAQIYGGIDCYYTPFIRWEKGEARYQDMKRLERSLKSNNVAPVPQVIFKSREEFVGLADAIKALGCKRINLNLGCPFPMQTSKGRGCAMVSNATTMAEISELINSDSDTDYSIKMRLGMIDPREWESIMPILNATRLEYIVMHPRVGKQMYDGEIYQDQFERFLSLCKNPVIWNGDVRSTSDISTLVEKYPNIKGIMIGRGLLSRPSLAKEWRENSVWEHQKAMSSLLLFHEQLLEEYESRLCGETQILHKIKPFWDYLEAIIGHKQYKAIKKATTLNKYRLVIKTIE